MKRREFVRTMTAAGSGLMLSARGSLWADGERLDAAQPDVPKMRAVMPDPQVRRVLVMFKCHFDAGFIDTQANVVQKYFAEYFPRAIEIARAANAGGKRRYVWTTGSWLLYEYLEQASPAARKTMEQAIARGDIAWHALPFTWQTEMLDQSMIEGSIGLSHELDRRFGLITTGAKMTDVPGHTRGLIAPLVKQGIGFLEIGVNSGSTVAKVPPVFLWKSPSGAGLPVMYHWDYGATARVPGSDLALVTSVRGDNAGPHTEQEIAGIHSQLAEQFPKAQIKACSLSEMAQAIAPYRDKLPVVTEEIGDTWIYGVASDPLKVARYREIARLRQQWIGEHKFKAGDSTDLALLRRLLLEPEHTWGTDTKTWLDFDNYEPRDLEKMLDTKNYKVVQFSWQEKRQDLLDAVSVLPGALRAEAQKAIASLKPTAPAIKGDALAASQTVDTPHYILDSTARLARSPGCATRKSAGNGPATPTRSR